MPSSEEEVGKFIRPKLKGANVVGFGGVKWPGLELADKLE